MLLIGHCTRDEYEFQYEGSLGWALEFSYVIRNVYLNRNPRESGVL